MDRAAIEEIVAEILERKGKETVKQGSHIQDEREESVMEQGTVKQEQKKEGEQPQKEIDQATLALIADTMSAFRSS